MPLSDGERMREADAATSQLFAKAGLLMSVPAMIVGKYLDGWDGMFWIGIVFVASAVFLIKPRLDA